jgi:alkylhydroperoxidase family enzyme
MTDNDHANVRSFTELEIERRTALILDAAPRLTPLELEDLSQELGDILARMSQVNNALDSRQKEMLIPLLEEHEAPSSSVDVAAEVGKLPEIIRTMLRHGELFAQLTDMGIQLLARGTLPPRDRELAVLRIGWLCQAPYEWGEHVMVAKKLGIGSEEIERITQGSAAPGWSEHDRAIVRAAEELHSDAMISDATWATLAESFTDKQLIELPVVIGQYQMVAYYQNSLRLRLHDGNAGLKTR